MHDFILRLIVTFLLFGGISTRAEPVPLPPEPTVEMPEAQAAPASPLLEAMQFASPETETLAFTDWSRLKAALSAQSITGASSVDDRIAFLIGATQDLGAASGFALADFERQAATWGWDSTDLLWEATLSGGPPGYILRLRDDFDLDALIARFEDRGFERREQGDALLFSHPLDLSADWRTDLAVFNAAILPARHVLIHSSSPDAIDAALAAYAQPSGSWREAPAYHALAVQLDGAASALIGSGAVMCMPFDPTALLLDDADEATRALAAALARGEGAAPLAAMAVGYIMEGDAPLGRLLFEHYTPLTAEQSLAARKTLAEQGVSNGAQRPYRDVLFTVTDAGVDGSTVFLDVRPLNGGAHRLFEMVYRRDMAFAVCP